MPPSPSPVLALHPPPAPATAPGAGLRGHLACPDGSALVGDGGHAAEPVALAAALGAAVVGGGSWLVAAVLGLLPLGLDPAGATAAGDAARGLGAALGGVLLAGLLTLPPLVLLSTLGRREGSLHQVVAAATVGPAVCGAWLGATAPVVLLYAPTAHGGEPGEGVATFLLLVLALGLLAFVQGGVAAVRRARRAGAASPGVAAVLVHYLLTTWTALVLTLHLA